ncbi:MAG: ABC transporter substrate-binding protein, partial [Devosia sp.]
MVALLSVSPAVLAQAAFDKDAVIQIGSLYEPQNLDNTAGAGQGINEAFNGNVYEALFALTDAGTVENALAKDYTVSEDGLTYTFTLQSGVTFHSGDPLTAADVKASIERVTTEASKSSRKKSLATIAKIETPDDATVVITLSEKSISLP